MTRSQGPNDQTPPQWRQTTRAAQPQGANDQQAHWQPQQQQQQPPSYEADPYLQHGGQVPQYHQPQEPAANYPQGGEQAYPAAYDHYAQQGSYGAGQPQPQQHYPDPTYAQPAYEMPPAQPGYPDQYAAQQGYSDPQYGQPAQDYAQPSQDYPGDDYWGGGANGLGNPGQQSPFRQAPDNQAYDLGNYMPAGGDSRPAFGEPGYRPLQNWDVGANTYADPGQPADRGFDQGGYPGGMPSRFEGAVAHHSDTYGHEHEEDFEYDDEDEEPGGGRKMIIAAALVAAIVVGGGFAYGYNALFGGAGSPGGDGTPIVKAESGPAKTQPSDPGGRQFEHKDSQVLGKLSGDGQNSTAYAKSEGDANGRVRSVSTLVVGRDGRLIVPDNAQSNNAESNSQPAPNAAPAGTITSTSPVPGLTIVGVNPPAAAQEAPPSAPSTPPSSPPQALGAGEVQPSNEVAPQPAAESQPAAPAQTVTAAVTPPQAQPQPKPAATRSRRRSKLPPLPVRSSARTAGQAVAAAAPAQTAAPAPGVAQARVTPVVPQQNQQQAAAPATTASVPAAASGNGYVAVLSTKRSRIDALTSFADLQQKYGNILGNKVPAVRRADLSARGLGIMYRAVVGPPGSRQAAAQVCTQLKSAGYSGCWVAPY